MAMSIPDIEKAVKEDGHTLEEVIRYLRERTAYRPDLYEASTIIALERLYLSDEGRSKAARRQQRYRLRKKLRGSERFETELMGDVYVPPKRYTRETIHEHYEKQEQMRALAKAEEERAKTLVAQVSTPPSEGESAITPPPTLSPDDTFLAQLAAITPQPLPGRSENIFKRKDERDGE